MAPLPPWWRNQLAATIASFIGFTGFTQVVPLLPLYFRELGVTDVGEIAMWSGVSLGVTPAIAALLSPFWGRLGDRFGRKVMIERSFVCFTIVMMALGYVTRAWHIVALRAVQGVFGGYGSLTIVMAAESAPRERMAAAIGMVQTAQRLGPAVGPVLGGAIAQIGGLRRAFLVSAAFYAAAFVLVLLLYEERQVHESRVEGQAGRTTFRDVLAFDNFALLMCVVFGLQFIDRSIGPILPLYIVDLGVPLDRAPIVAGMLFSIIAAAAAIGNQTCARVLLNHWTPQGAMLAASGVTAVTAAFFVIGAGVWPVAIGLGVFGWALGVGMTAAYAAASSVISKGAHGVGFGVLTSASLVGLAVSPVINGALATTNIRAVFVLDVAVVLVLGVLVSGKMKGGRLRPEALPPVVEP